MLLEHDISGVDEDRKISMSTLKDFITQTIEQKLQDYKDSIADGTTVAEKANLAEKAVNDSEGNAINNTYAKDSDLQDYKSKIADGTVVAKKAENDSSGNPITSTYVKKSGRENISDEKIFEDITVTGTLNIQGSAVGIKQFNVKVVSQLPESDISTNTIYLVAKQNAQTDNLKDEYINIDGTVNGWEKIGDTALDISELEANRIIYLTTRYSTSEEAERAGYSIKTGTVCLYQKRLYKAAVSSSGSISWTGLQGGLVNSVTESAGVVSSMQVDGTSYSFSQGKTYYPSDTVSINSSNVIEAPLLKQLKRQGIVSSSRNDGAFSYAGSGATLTFNRALQAGSIVTIEHTKSDGSLFTLDSEAVVFYGSYAYIRFTDPTNTMARDTSVEFMSSDNGEGKVWHLADNSMTIFNEGNNILVYEKDSGTSSWSITEPCESPAYFDSVWEGSCVYLVNYDAENNFFNYLTSKYNADNSVNFALKLNDTLYKMTVTQTAAGTVSALDVYSEEGNKEASVYTTSSGRFSSANMLQIDTAGCSSDFITFIYNNTSVQIGVLEEGASYTGEIIGDDIAIDALRKLVLASKKESGVQVLKLSGSQITQQALEPLLSKQIVQTQPMNQNYQEGRHFSCIGSFGISALVSVSLLDSGRIYSFKMQSRYGSYDYTLNVMQTKTGANGTPCTLKVLVL